MSEEIHGIFYLFLIHFLLTDTDPNDTARDRVADDALSVGTLAGRRKDPIPAADIVARQEI